VMELKAANQMLKLLMLLRYYFERLKKSHDSS
jgi:hypothetical protein